MRFRNVCGLEGANSTEMDENTKYPVVIDMPEHNQVKGPIKQHDSPQNHSVIFNDLFCLLAICFLLLGCVNITYLHHWLIFNYPIESRHNWVIVIGRYSYFIFNPLSLQYFTLMLGSLTVNLQISYLDRNNNFNYFHLRANLEEL